MDKIKRISFLLITFILVINLNVLSFAFLYDINNSIVNTHIAEDFSITVAKASFFDALYFSGITYLTIGYGDFKAVNSIGKFLAVLQGFSGVLINSIFTGIFLYYLVKRPKNILISNKLYIRYKQHKKRYYLSVRVGNKGRALVNVNRILELFTYENNIKKRRLQLSQEYHYLEDLLYWDIDLEEEDNKQLLCYLKQCIFEDKDVTVRISITGTDVDAGDLVFVAKHYSRDDIMFIKDYHEIYRHQRDKKPKINWKNFHRAQDLDKNKIEDFKEL